MDDRHDQADFDALLGELEAQVLADPGFAAEHATALDAFAAGTEVDAALRLRFREWFLLERDLTALGAPPALAWAPEALAPEDLWHRLLDSFFGIFQTVELPGEERPVLEDLWSGRQVRLHRSLPSDGPELVVVGRCAQGGEDFHVLMPGAVFLAAEGLAEAFAVDLSRIRSEQPRSRLSQGECERLLLPFREGPEAPEEMQAEEAIEALERALHGAEAWSSDRLLELAMEEGVTEALNTLAFETEVDLEPIRHALSTLQDLGSRPAEPVDEGSAGDSQGLIPPDRVEDALAAFDLASNRGIDLATRFTELENALGLDQGSSDPFPQGAGSVDAEPMGPEEVPGVSLWLATFLWERDQTGEGTSEELAREAGEFLSFLDRTHEGALEPEEVGRGDVLGYLLSAADPASLERIRIGLQPFLLWLTEEQGAPLLETLRALDSTDGNLLARAVDLNHRLQEAQASRDSMARIQALDPPQVAAEDGEKVPVQWNGGLDFRPDLGDAVLGHWHQGQFHLGAWLPKQLEA